MRRMRCARALMRALQRERPRIAVRETVSAKSVQGPGRASSWRGADLHSAPVFQKLRWAPAACPLPPAACGRVHAASFSSAASPSVSGKPGAPGPPTDDAATVASSEDKPEPIPPPFTGDGKATTGVRQDLRSCQDVAKENEELLALLTQQQALLEEKDRALTEAKAKLLRSYAEMENLMERTRREAESTRKYSIQEFAKSLLDVADNLGRAVEIVRNSESSADAEANAKLVKSLLEGVEMTEKQLMKVFEKHGLERFSPELGEVFDPNQHQAVYEVDDAAKPPGTVAVVLKTGYKLHDRVIRPAVVGVVKGKSQ